MKHPIFNTDHSDNCYCKLCEKESERYLKELEYIEKPLILDEIKFELYSKGDDNNFRLDIFTKNNSIVLNKKDSKEIYLYLKKCLSYERNI